MVNCLPEDGGGSRPRFRGSKKQAVATTDALRDGLRDLLRDGLVTRDVSQPTKRASEKRGASRRAGSQFCGGDLPTGLGTDAAHRASLWGPYGPMAQDGAR